MKHEIRWGILGPGAISRAFAAALNETGGARLVAVASRSKERAERFASGFGIPESYASYPAMASRPELDAVYVATPHALHEEHATLCLRAGKHVLCEKPLAVSAAQARRMIRVAREHDRLLMEAMWTRFLPSIACVREVVASRAIGVPRLLTAGFGFRIEFNRSGRHFDPALAGGALLDLGVYPISLGTMLFGPPVEVTGVANLGETGVDEDCSVLLRHAEGEMTVAAASFRVDTAREATIQGTEGWIRLHDPWWGGNRVTIGTGSPAVDTRDCPRQGAGYGHQAAAFMELIRTGQRDSPVMPLAESLSVLETMDALRERWGVRYPGE
jgi:predicted dehydrogenase